MAAPRDHQDEMLTMNTCDYSIVIYIDKQCFRSWSLYFMGEKDHTKSTIKVEIIGYRAEVGC
jgi:hypothetical protein